MRALSWVLLLAPAAVAAQVRPPAAAPPTQPRVAARLQAQLGQVLPAWDDAVLRALDAPDWTNGISFARVLGAVRDSQALPANVPRDARQVRLGEGAVVFDPAIGSVMYVSQQRSFDGRSRTNPTLPSMANARDTILAMTRVLGLPQAELGPIKEFSQIAASAAILRMGVARDSIVRTPIYRMVAIQRQVNSLPVQESRVLASVNERSQVQRVTIAWPRFRLLPDLALRSRAEVITEAVGQIIEQTPDGRATFVSKLAYVPRGVDDRTVYYVPAIVLSVNGVQSPYQIIVSVAR